MWCHGVPRGLRAGLDRSPPLHSSLSLSVSLSFCQGTSNSPLLSRPFPLPPSSPYPSPWRTRGGRFRVSPIYSRGHAALGRLRLRSSVDAPLSVRRDRSGCLFTRNAGEKRCRRPPGERPSRGCLCTIATDLQRRRGHRPFADGRAHDERPSRAPQPGLSPAFAASAGEGWWPNQRRDHYHHHF